MKDPKPTATQISLKLPAELAARFLPTENKAAVIREALAAYFDNRDKK